MATTCYMFLFSILFILQVRESSQQTTRFIPSTISRGSNASNASEGWTASGQTKVNASSGSAVPNASEGLTITGQTSASGLTISGASDANISRSLATGVSAASGNLEYKKSGKIV
uniref:Uncharacterized protein n=1 Tax=Romanomermis culicivorax TaxID=13658 RepID=A0A915KAX5_ROMCU